MLPPLFSRQLWSYGLTLTALFVCIGAVSALGLVRFREKVSVSRYRWVDYVKFTAFGLEWRLRTKRNRLSAIELVG